MNEKGSEHDQQRPRIAMRKQYFLLPEVYIRTEHNHGKRSSRQVRFLINWGFFYHLSHFSTREHVIQLNDYITVFAFVR